MSTAVAEASIPSQMARPKILNGDVRRQMYRVRKLPGMIGAVGTTNTTRAVLRGLTGNPSEEPITLSRQADGLKFPFHLTDTFSDIWSYVEVHRKRAYDLPKAVDAKINGKPIVDIGAYIGASATYFASRYPDSPVLAFEPHPRNYHILRVNSRPYDGQIQALQAAVAAENTDIGIHAHGALQSDYMVNAFVPHAPNYGMSIASRTPSDITAMLGSDEIGLLKVDIEGAEALLFQSPAIDPLLQRAGILLIESHEKFESGSEQAIHDATERNGMYLIPFNSHTSMYARA